MKEYKAKWKNKDFDACYLFYGEEPYLMKNYETTLLNEILTKEEQDMNFDVLEETAISAEAIISIVETYPFFAEKRMVIVRNSHFFTKDGKKEEATKLMPLLQNLPESTCLLFVEDKVQKNNALYKQIVKSGVVLEFKKLDDLSLRKWIKKEVENHKFQIEMSTVVYFVQNISQDMTFIQSELEKLMAYKSGSKEITVADIKEICSPSVEVRVFDLVRAVAEGKGIVASTIYRELLALKESPYLILSLITQQFRRMLLTRSLMEEERLTIPVLAKKLSLNEYAVKQYAKQSQQFQQKSLENALAECLEIDLKIKTGLMHEETAVELFIMKYSFQSS